MTPLQVSVIICTHNPRRDYLATVLDALKVQTLPKDQWELLLIDNASKEPLATVWDLSWHSNARHIREEELGLTPARLRGIKEAQGELLVFVDDDNVLQRDYLGAVLSLFEKWPQLAVIGGATEGKFETPPPEWTRPMWPSLVIRPLKRDAWSNVWGGDQEAIPYGAGMAVRAPVARNYADRTIGNRLGFALDRKGSNLSSGGDISMVMTALEMGFGVGRFQALQMSHLIPPFRLEEDYLVRLAESLEFSWWILHRLHGLELTVPKPSWRRSIANAIRMILLSRRERRFFRARMLGRARASVALKEFENPSGTRSRV